MKPRTVRFVDNKLKHRVMQYLTSNRCGKYVDTEVLASDLQRMYSIDYGRRKRNAFRIQVEKAFNVIGNEMEFKHLTESEDEHRAKRARRDEEDNEYTESYSDDDSDTEDYADPQSANHMNSSLLSLYRKGNPGSGSNVPEMEQRERTASTPCITSKGDSVSLKIPARESEGRWFIGKIQGGKKERFFLDVSNKRNTRKKPLSEIQDSKDSSLLEREKKRKDRIKNKANKKKKKYLQEVDRKIEDVLHKKANSWTPELQNSTVKFEDVGGNDATLKEVCKLVIHMRHPEVYQHLGVVPPRGVLLHGPPGCGKTLLAHAIAGELNLPILKVAAPEVVSGVSGESEEKLRELFSHAVSNAPCILFIDEIDAITPKREVASKDMERRIVAQLLTCMDDLNNMPATAQVLVIGATNRPDSLDPALRRAGRFDREICLGIPDEASRVRILQTLCRKLRLPESFNFCHLAHLTPGFVGADLMALCREAAMCAVNRILMNLQQEQQKHLLAQRLSPGAGQQPREAEPASALQDELQRLLELLRDHSPLSEEQMHGLCIELNDFIVALSSVQPSAKREGFVTVPSVTWEDVGALEDIREELTMAIVVTYQHNNKVWREDLLPQLCVKPIIMLMKQKRIQPGMTPVRKPDLFKALGLVTPAGVLLVGPPGCGKTLLAKAVANESGLNFISVKGPELLNMYVGESEHAVRGVFQRAKSSCPCVIFFDEVDALCARRSGRETGASDRVVNQLLTEMDGVEARQQVFIMAATNRPDIIDPAFLRPGRLDKTLFVGLPPPADRLAILKTITKNGTRPPLDADVNLEAIASDLRCDGYTGADLSALVREASLCALRQEMARQKSGEEKGKLKVGQKHFEDAFKKVKSSISVKDRMMYDALQRSLTR